MANMFLISSRSRRSKNPKGKRSSSNSNSDNNFSCKKHKKHIQSPGICSICLTEKLTKLSLQYNEYTKSYTNVAADETVSSYCSSSTSSSSTLVSSCYTLLLLRSLLVLLLCNVGIETRRIKRNKAFCSDYCLDP
ncbi:unnamed protein product [Cochlearia groenlandica]